MDRFHGRPYQPIGACAVVDTGRRLSGFEGTTIDKQRSTADGWIYDVYLGEAMLVRLAYLRWATGEREIRTQSRSKWCTDYAACPAPEPFYEQFADRERLRLTIKDMPGGTHRYAVLKLAAADAQGRPQLCKASWSEMDRISGIDSRSLLRQVGCTALGTKEEILGDPGIQRGWPCIAFPAKNLIAPVCAFVLTRVLPVYRMRF